MGRKPKGLRYVSDKPTLLEIPEELRKRMLDAGNEFRRHYLGGWFE